ncbi:MAG: BlaI/MecI/CopY family transcriptional regulator [Bacteroidales bacterium]|nr:BlaI/MecI/CopY family transcriptional regulator [Candidatus Colimorpha pelethequi]
MARKTKQETDTLTKAEEQVMQAVWQLGKGFAGEIANTVKEPKPAYRTVLSIVRILEQKGFVGHKDYNGNNQYYPLVSKKDYSGKMLGALVKNYFDTSYASLVSFFINDKNISEEDLAALERIIEQKRNEK